MVIKTSNYTQTKHKGLKQSKLDKNKYLLDFRIRGLLEFPYNLDTF